MENKFAKKKKEKLEGAGVFVRGRGVSGVECGSAWEWAWVRVGFYFYCHCFVLLFLFLLFVSCFWVFSFLFAKFHKVQNVLFPNFSRATVLFWRVSSFPNTEKVNQKRKNHHLMRKTKTQNSKLKAKN